MIYKGVIPVDKKILSDYIDACAFIKETEKEINRLKKNKKTVIDKVKGSNPNFPYEPRSFGVVGTTETYANADALRREEQLLETQKKEAEELKVQVDEWMNTIPFRMQRIIRYKIFKELTWEEVAKLMGRNSTGESVRMEYNRFMRKK